MKKVTSEKKEYYLPTASGGKRSQKLKQWEQAEGEGLAISLKTQISSDEGFLGQVTLKTFTLYPHF